MNCLYFVLRLVRYSRFAESALFCGADAVGRDEGLGVGEVGRDAGGGDGFDAIRAGGTIDLCHRVFLGGSKRHLSATHLVYLQTDERTAGLLHNFV